MTVSITLRGGITYTGKSVETIIRREFGPTAEFWPTRDRTSPEAGMIVAPVPYEDLGAFNVLADVLTITRR